MCTWGTDISIRVPIPATCSYTGKFRWDEKPVDSYLVTLIRALNRAGIYTGGSCCGHGKERGYISLHDGRVLIIEQVDPETMPCTVED